MKISSRIVFVVTVSILAALIFIYFFNKSSNSELQIEFNSLVEQSNQENLDLRGMRSIEWDELVVWTPYASICDYGITGYETGSISCSSSNDDGECYLLFLKSNRLVGKIKIYRPKIDLATSEIDGRISKNRTIFIYKTKGNFPI